MYEGKIVAETTVATPLDVRAQFADEVPARGSVLLGLIVLLVGLPLLVLRVFAHLIARDVRKLGTLAGIVGGAVRDARR